MAALFILAAASGNRENWPDGATIIVGVTMFVLANIPGALLTGRRVS
jgi:hypothetical protein